MVHKTMWVPCGQKHMELPWNYHKTHILKKYFISVELQGIHCKTEALNHGNSMEQPWRLHGLIIQSRHEIHDASMHARNDPREILFIYNTIKQCSSVTIVKHYMSLQQEVTFINCGNKTWTDSFLPKSTVFVTQNQQCCIMAYNKPTATICTCM